MRSNLFHLALVAGVALGAVSTADAKPRRVVVLEFDGPRQLADAGRSAVMSVLGEQYNIVATKNWDAARARASGRGPQQWRQASKQAGVDAVIEGWVQPEGRHNVLTIAVREAATGNEIDTLSVRLRDRGMTSEATHKIAAQLDDVLSWIDGDITADPAPTLPDVRTVRPMLGGRDPARERERERVAELEEDDEDRRSSRRDRKPRRGLRSEELDDRDGRADRSRRDDRDDRRDERDRDDRRDDRDDRDDRRTSNSDDKPEKKVAATDETSQDTNDLVKLFGPDSKEAEIVTEGKTKHVPKPTPRFSIGAGPYVAARGMAFETDPTAKTAPPEYPASILKGFNARAAVYPMPVKKQDGDLSGVGFSLNLSKSVMSVFTASDETGFADFTLDHTAWETGVHYRWPIEFVAIDVDASFGNNSYVIQDLPESIQIPDTQYSYLGAGARIDLKVTEGTTIGFGARYLYLLSAGQVSEEDAYGAGKAWGAALDGNFVIPISGPLYVQGAIEYRHVKLDFEGSGGLTKQFSVWSIGDSQIAGTGNLGVKF